MPTQNAHDAVWTALQALDKPVDFDTTKAAGIAATQAVGASAQEFGQWFDLNGAGLVAKLNSLS